MTLALLSLEDGSIVEIIPDGRPFVELPGVGQVSPPEAGWKGGGKLIQTEGPPRFEIVAVKELDVPEGKQRAGERVYQKIGEELVETTPLEDAPEPPKVSEVSRRQFMMQLHVAGLDEPVRQWVEAQGGLVKIAFDNSASFKKDDPMMHQGFLALGFNETQRDDFFEAASKL